MTIVGRRRRSDRTDPTRYVRTRRGPAMGVRSAHAAVALALLAGCTAGGSTDEAVDVPATTPAPTTTVSATAAPADDTRAIDAGGGAGAADGAIVHDPSIPEVTDQFSRVEAGDHRFTVLGIEVAVRLTEPVMVQPNRSTQFVLTSFASQGPGDEDLIFLRATSLQAPDALGDGDAPPWPVDDIEGWIDDVPGTAISAVETVEIGGRRATAFRIDLDDDAPCTPDCILARSEVGEVFLLRGIHHRVWHIPVEGSTPIIVLSGEPAPDAPWSSVVDRIVAALDFGPDRPHPIVGDAPLWERGISAEVPAGIVTLPIAGAITFELDTDTFVAQRPGTALIFPLDDLPAENDILVARSTAAGSITTLDDALDRLEEHSGVVVTATEALSIGGRDALRVDVEGRGVPVLSWEDPYEADQVWLPPTWGSIWFVDIGLDAPLAVTSESFGDRELLEITDASALRILETLEVGPVSDRGG